jgi:hypothetical protein
VAVALTGGIQPLILRKGLTTTLVKVVAISLLACTILKIALVIPSLQMVTPVFCFD